MSIGTLLLHLQPQTLHILKNICSTHAAGEEGWVRPSGDLEEAVVENAGEQAASEVVPELCSSNASP